MMRLGKYRVGPTRIVLLIALAAGPACARPGVAPVADEGAASGAHIFLPPPLRWNHAMLRYSPALHQTATDFANLTGGLAFGASPVAVNAQLPKPYPNLSWEALSLASEYPGEVRFFGLPFGAAGALRMGVTACAGSGSYIVFLFNANGLFRLSYRLVADKACPDTSEAARVVFGRYVTLGERIALSVRYETGHTQVVDITDPQAGYLAPVRWRQAGE